MKRIPLPLFRNDLPPEPQFAKYFAPCGLNADWSAAAYHLSTESITGNKPNTKSGDYYLVQNEEYAGGWIVFIRTYEADRTDANKDKGGDLIEEVAAFTCAEHAWDWLRDPVSQAFFLHSPVEDLNDARGLPHGPERFSAPELQAPLSIHDYTRDYIHRVSAEESTVTGTGYEYQHVALGFDKLLAGRIEGTGYVRRCIGYPNLTIPEARAVAKQIVHRWNRWAPTCTALEAAVTALVQAVQESGHSVSGPTDSRAAEKGEPAWVCEARAAIAEAHAAIKANAEGTL
jgi:hypothetical protein